MLFRSVRSHSITLPLEPKEPEALHDKEPSPTSEPELPKIDLDGASPLVRLDYSVLMGNEWGTAWNRCVDLFILGEQIAGFPEPSGPQLPARGRPAVYADWFKKHRSCDGPDIRNIGDFSLTFTNWYWSLQPNERGQDKRSRLDIPVTSWSKFRKPGRNGIYLILAGLLWIGRAIFDGGHLDLKDNWDNVVEDLLWVLDVSSTEAATNAAPAPSKRKAASGASSRKRARAS